ncbi:hypothetical protein [Rosistilla oblonga]|uniref:hypothetical protein n=1 Tax=Rosistilla oblonga TaxID=2527990 RepID=UPI003A985008
MKDTHNSPACIEAFRHEFPDLRYALVIRDCERFEKNFNEYESLGTFQRSLDFNTRTGSIQRMLSFALSGELRPREAFPIRALRHSKFELYECFWTGRIETLELLDIETHLVEIDRCCNASDFLERSWARFDLCSLRLGVSFPVQVDGFAGNSFRQRPFETTLSTDTQERLNAGCFPSSVDKDADTLVLAPHQTTLWRSLELYLGVVGDGMHESRGMGRNVSNGVEANPNVEAKLAGLKPAERKAYSAFQYVAEKKEVTPKELKDEDAWDYLNSVGIEGTDALCDYKPPKLDTFTRYLTAARKAMGELKTQPKTCRGGRSIVKRSEI